MTRLCQRSRLPWIALAAIVGLLSMAGETTACELRSAPKAARSCCASRPASGACGACCGTPEGPATVAGSAIPASVEVGPVHPRQNCECRSGEPASPAPKPESRPGQTRPDRDRDAEVASSFEERSPVTFAPLVPRLDGPPKIPLYLRTSRLLI